jgi:SAM-dependent methyltransferase
MTQTPVLFDTPLAMTRARRRMRLQDGADFLLRRIAEDLVDRLAPVLRPFPAILDFATPDQSIVERLKQIRPTSSLRHVSLHDQTILNSANGLEALNLAPDQFDLITSGLILQHANDLPGVLVQLRRGLKPDGLFLGCLAGGATLTELRQSLTQAESEIVGGVSPRVFPFADVRDMGGLLQRAGFALPVTDSEIVTVRYKDMFALIDDLRAMGATNTLVARSRRMTRRSVMMRAADIYATRFADADGRIRATFEILWLSGWAPHESQQKPLRPGSAKARLADALRVPEQKL